MATISRFNAVCKVGKLEFGGFLAWLAWLGLHLYYLVGGRNRLIAVISWFVTFLGCAGRWRSPSGGVRAQGDGPSPREADPEGHRVTCGHLCCAQRRKKCPPDACEKID